MTELLGLRVTTYRDVMTGLYTNTKECTSFKRCKQYRICEHCNNARQAKLCDVTELASRFSNKATYAVIMPYGHAQKPEVISAIKSKVIRKIKPSIDGSFISVETSPNKALHLNLVLTHQAGFNPDPIKKILKNMNVEASLFCEQIDPTAVRNVTAYALKLQSIPEKDQYTGNQYNMTGMVKTAGHIMQSHRMMTTAPIVALKSMNNTLEKYGLNPISSELLDKKYLLAELQNLNFLVAQLDNNEMNYSPETGLISNADFISTYQDRMIKIINKIP